MLSDHLSEDQIEKIRQAQKAGRLSQAQKARIVELSKTPGEQPTQTEATQPTGSQIETGLGRGGTAFFDSEANRQTARDASRKASLSEQTGGVITRGAFESVGGTVGAALGVPAGPLGIAGGGAGGTALGSLAFDTLEDFMRMTGGLNTPEEARDPLAPTLQALSSAKDDLLFAQGFQVAGNVLAATKPMIGKILGVRTPEIQDIVKLAEAANLKVGAVDVMTGIRGKLARGGSKVLGIFPFLGTPFRQQAKGKAAVLVSTMDNLLNRLAPNAVMADDLGIDMTKAARGSIKKFRDQAGANYDEFRRLATNASRKDIIPSKPIKGAAGLLVKRSEDGRILLENDEVLTGASADVMDKFIRDLTALPDNLSMPQFEKLTDQLQEFVKKASADGFDVKRFMGIKKAMEKSLSDIKVGRLKEGEGEALLAAKKTADNFFSKGILQFQSPTAKKFARVNKNIFKPGFKSGGHLNADEISDVIVNLKSPQAVRDLSDLVGSENMGKASRKHLERVWDDARISNEAGEIIGMNWNKLRADFGLTGATADKKAALKALMKTTNVKIEEVENIINIASKLVVPKDVNTFIARRAALGGFSAALAGATTGGLVKGNKLKSLAVALFIRNAADIMSSPVQLKAMQRVLSPKITDVQRSLLLGRLAEAIDTNLEDEED